MLSLLSLAAFCAGLTLSCPVNSTTIPFITSGTPVTYGAGVVVTTTVALSFYNSDFTHGTAGNSNASTYTYYSGPASNFPAMSRWMNFNDMFTVAQNYSLNVLDTSPQISDIYDAIVNVSTQAMVDARVILAVMIQESSGNVNVPCNGSVPNCGLMQAYNSTDTSFDPSNSLATITQMIVDGTQGTLPTGSGLVQLFNDQDTTGGNIYNVVRAYNSGSNCMNLGNLSSPVDSTASYVSDIANLLQGCMHGGSGASGCRFVTSGACADT